MSTPASLKRADEAKAKAQQNKSRQGEVLAPLTNKAKNFSNFREKDLIDFSDDKAVIGGGRQQKLGFLSFERSKNFQAAGRKPRNGPIVLAPQEVVEPPLGMGTDDYVIDSSKLVCFNGKEHFLSALYPAKMKIDNHEYLSVEHYYQACKLYSLAGSEQALKLQHIQEPIRVKTAAKNILMELKVSNEKINEWKETHGFIMLHHAIVHKFVQNLDLQKKLIETDDGLLCQSYERESLYACGMDKAELEKWAKDNDGKIIKIPSELSVENIKYIPLMGRGRNIMGAMCMKIRKQIMNLTAEDKSVTLDPFLPQIFSSLTMATKETEKDQKKEPQL